MTVTHTKDGRLHGSIVRRIKGLHERDFPIKDIARLCKVPRKEVEAIVGPPKPLEPSKELQLARQRMLHQVPTWWKGTAEAYKACVKSNFADVA